MDVVTVPKLKIARAVKKALCVQDVKLRDLAATIGISHPQICRITKPQNYNIETLLKILDGLGLELIIREKIK